MAPNTHPVPNKPKVEGSGAGDTESASRRPGLYTRLYALPISEGRVKVGSEIAFAENGPKPGATEACESRMTRYGVFVRICSVSLTLKLAEPEVGPQPTMRFAKVEPAAPAHAEIAKVCESSRNNIWSNRKIYPSGTSHPYLVGRSGGL